MWEENKRKQVQAGRTGVGSDCILMRNQTEIQKIRRQRTVRLKNGSSHSNFGFAWAKWNQILLNPEAGVDEAM